MESRDRKSAPGDIEERRFWAGDFPARAQQWECAVQNLSWRSHGHETVMYVDSDCAGSIEYACAVISVLLQLWACKSSHFH